TPSSPLWIMVWSALPPPPPTPTTLIRACTSASSANSMLNPMVACPVFLAAPCGVFLRARRTSPALSRSHTSNGSEDFAEPEAEALPPARTVRGLRRERGSLHRGLPRRHPQL